MTKQDVFNLLSLDEGANAIMMTRQELDAKLYQEVKTDLVKNGGKWQGGKFWGFRFPGHIKAAEILTRLQAGDQVNKTKERQLYVSTPIVREAIMEHVREFSQRQPRRPIYALEPSAGTGVLVNELLHFFGAGVRIDVCEKDNDLRQAFYLVGEAPRPGVAVAGADFMALERRNKYDLIVANPPFAGYQGEYCDHITKMFWHMRGEGKSLLVSVAPADWTYAERGRKAMFKEWLFEVGGAWHPLPDNAFKESGTLYKTGLVVFNR